MIFVTSRIILDFMNIDFTQLHLAKKWQTIPVCETSRFPHFLDSRLTDEGEVVSLTRRPPSTPGRFLVLISFICWDHSATRRIISIEKSSDLIGNRTRDLPACNTAPQANVLPRASQLHLEYRKIHRALSILHYTRSCCVVNYGDDP
jgi:hypothetical protein